MATPGMGSALSLVKSTLLPRLFKTGPPNYYTQTAFSKRLDVSANFVVNDAGLAASTNEKVPTATGLITWQPNRGAGSIYRWGIVPQGAVRSAGSANCYLLPQGTGTNLVFGSATAVPYNQAVTQDVIKISPDLSQSFSQVRVYSGDLRVICDTVPIGNTALNGYFSAGSVSDSRDVSQVNEGTGNPSNCFNPSDLVQTSVTSKEGLKEISVMKGIITLVGSDIQPFYAPPNTDQTDTQTPGWTTYSAPDGGVATTLAANVFHVFANAMISPWNVQTTTTPIAGYAPLQNIPTGPINLNGCLDFHVVCSLTSDTAAADASPGMELVCQFNHIFATCESGTGAVPWGCTYVTQQESYVQSLGQEFSQAYPNPNVDTSGITTVFASSPRLYQGSLASTGIYLGTQIIFQLSNSSSATASTRTYTFNYVTYQVSARSVYNQGELGPTRIIRWDGMSDNQQIKVDGVINAQCIPEGNIAPFVQSAAMFSDTAHNLNSLTFLAELYNGESPIRRNWTLDEYLTFVGRDLESLSPESIMGMNQPKLSGVAQAAGVFDFLGPALNVAGGMLPFLADGDYNSAGSGYMTGPDPTNQMYNGEAYGQFGSAGSFGRRRGRASDTASAYGMFR